MSRRKIFHFIKSLRPVKAPRAVAPATLHSMLLPLEPRMVFDASAPAVAEALDHHDAQPQSDMQTFQAEGPSVPADAHRGTVAADKAAPISLYDTTPAEVKTTAPVEARDTTLAHSSAASSGLDELVVPTLPTTGWSEASSIDFSGGVFTAAEDATLTFGAGGIRLSDPDSTDFIITISVDKGTLSLDYVPGVAGNQYHWNSGHTAVWFQADKTVAQQVLDTLKYTGGKYYNGNDVLTVTVDDAYNHSQTFTHGITVTPVPNKPDFAGLPGTPGITQPLEDGDTSLRFNYGTADVPNWSPLHIFDPDSGDAGYHDTYDLTLTITHGTLSSQYGSHTLSLASDIAGVRTYALSGLSIGEVNGILANLKYLGDKDYNGKAQLGVTVTDLDPQLPGNTLDKTFELDVLPVNDPPALDPADAADRDHQLHVKEVMPDNSTSAEGIFDLSHFNTAWDPANPTHQPDAEGNIPLFDVDNNLHQLVVKIDSAPAQGDLWLKIGGSWVKLGAGSTFSLWDVYSGNVKYVHDPDLQVRNSVNPGSESDSFAYTVSDGAGGSDSGVVHVALEPVNQPPKIEVVPGGILTRVDSSWVPDPVTGNPVETFTVWGYEGEQGIVYSFSVIDPDQTPGVDFKVSFTVLPPALYGVFYYSSDNGATYHPAQVGEELSLDALQAGFLRFCHSGAENAVGTFQFTIAVTDDGGGEGPAGEKTVEFIMNFNIRPNNDNPEWAGGVAGLWDNPDHTHTVTGSSGQRTFVIDSSLWNLTDTDSDRQNLTYTVQYDPSKGQLLYYVGQDSQSNPIYRIVSNGDKISQKDVDTGNLRWWFYGEGSPEADIRFTVRDGSICATPTPSDKEHGPGAPLPYPYGGPSPTGWEHGSGAFEGGIGTWQETSVGSGVYEWVLTTHTLHLVSQDIVIVESPPPAFTLDPVPHFSSPQDTAIVVEGKEVTITGGVSGMLNAWFTDGPGGAVIPPLNADSSINMDGDPARLVYRIEQLPQHGGIIYRDGGGDTVLGLYSSFTQQDVNDGKIIFRHDSSEHFYDNFLFSVSDGRTEAKNAGNSMLFSLKFDVTPVNDTPQTADGKDISVKEHDLASGASADHDTPGGSVTITAENIVVWDADGSGDKSGQAQYSTRNDLYIVITKLPEHGKLYYDGVEISLALTGGELSAVQAGGGKATWGSDSNMAGIAIISLADIKAGKLVYRHDGTESFYDAFNYIVSDNMGIATGDPGHDGGSVNAYEQSVKIVVQPVNDKPESTLAVPDHVVADESGSVVLNGANIHYVDPDGSPGAIQFIITELPQYGQITLNGKVLGVGAVFTQDDIDKGRVQYTHDGSENHADSFKFIVSDSIFTSAHQDADSVTIEINPVNLAPVITAPPELYVDSIAGGFIIDGIVIKDPDFGNFKPGDSGYPGSGIIPGMDHMTVIIDLSTTAGVDIDKVEVLFHNGGSGLATNSRNGNTITLVGSYADIASALSYVTVRSKTQSGTTYDPNGDIILKLTVHDGVWDSGNNSWIDPNGGKGPVYSSEKAVHVFISPLNDPPTIDNITSNTGVLSGTIVEDSGYALIKDSGNNPLFITDLDAFARGGNSITLTAGHGTLIADSVQGPRIDGVGTGTLTITGTISQINAVLATLKYKPDHNYNGTEIIKFTYRDNGNSGEPPAGITQNEGDASIGINDPYRYVVPNSGGKIGLAVDGEFVLAVTPANDAPSISAPDTVFISSPLVFGGTDGMGQPVKIILDDPDISDPNSTLLADVLTLTIHVDFGWLELANADLAPGVSIVSGASNTDTLVITGTLAGLNLTLQKLCYNRSDWNGGQPAHMALTLSDLANSNESNGSTAANSAYTITHTMTINCSDLNDPPAITMPGGNWIVEEDTAGKIFTGAGAISIGDPDTFGAQVYVAVSVDVGALSIAAGDLSAFKALFILSGPPADRDAYAVAADNKTIYFRASLDTINAALGLISYKAPANFNGEARVTVYVNDLGLWGDPSGGEVDVPSNPVGAGGTQAGGAHPNGVGLADTQTRVITVTAVNDAPSSTQNTVDFWGGSGSTSGDFEDWSAWTGKTVDTLFGSLFRDTTDEQWSVSNPTGSHANTFAGIIITGNAAQSGVHGEWQYSTDGISWTNVGACSVSDALYLDKSTQLRFVAAQDFNGVPGLLSVRFADNSVQDVAHNNPALPSNGNRVNASGAQSGNTTRYSATDITLSTFVRGVNDAPTIAPGKDSQALSSANEDAAGPAGSSVSSLFGSSFSDARDSQTASGGSSANGLAGVVVTKNDADPAQGTWQYYNDSAWTAIGTGLSESNGLFLSAGTLIRFLPAADWNGTPGGLTVHLADNSAADTAHGNSALPGNYGAIDLTATGTGGTSRYSSGTVTLGTKITAVNDAPVVVGGSETLPPVLEDASSASNNGSTVASVFGQHFNDGKDNVKNDPSRAPALDSSVADTLAGVLVVGNDATAAQGVWQYSTNGGATWTDIPTTATLAGRAFALQAAWSVRFTPALDFNGIPGQLSIRLIDSSANATGNPSVSVWGTAFALPSTGGTTRYSAETIALGISVLAVNDAPVAGNKTVEFTEDTVHADTVGNLFSGTFNDAKDGKQSVGGSTASTADLFEGVFITGNAATPAQGAWSYSMDGGTTWTAIPTAGISAANALYLSKGTLIKFMPAPEYNGAVGQLQAHVMENYSGSGNDYSVGTQYDLSGKTGGSTHISASAAALTLSVTAVNDAPVAAIPNTPIDWTVNEDAGLVGGGANDGASVGSLFGTRFDDSKDQVAGGSSANTLAGILVKSVVNDPAKGTWQYYTGSNWTAIGNGMFLQSGTLIRFQPQADWNGIAPDLNAYLVENTGQYAGPLPASGTTQSYSYTGDGPFSKDTLALRMTVNAVNDAPSWNTDAFSPLFDNGTGGHFVGFDTLRPVPGNAATGITTIKTVQQALHGRDNAYAFFDGKDEVSGGSSANSLYGILVTGLQGDPALGTWQYYNGAAWANITGVSESNALFLHANTLIRFVSDTMFIIPEGTMPHSGLQIALVDNSGASGTMSAGGSYDASLARRGGINAVSSDVNALWTVILPANYYPEFVTPPASVTVNERETVRLSGLVSIKDTNLDNAVSTNHWGGASVTLQRAGGADADDAFSAWGGSLLSALNEGDNLVYNGIVYGTVTRNSGGVLTLSFAGNARASDVDAILQSISYGNISHDPPMAVRLQWMVDDGNYHDSNGFFPQGMNKSGDSSGKTFVFQDVTITPINEAPVAVDDLFFISKGAMLPLTGNVLVNDWDYDNLKANNAVNDPRGRPLVSVTASDASLAQYGTLLINADGSYSYALNTQNPLVAALQPGNSLTETISYTISDGEYTASAVLRIVIKLPPEATDDAGSIKTDARAPLEGNVLDNDLSDGNKPLTVIDSDAALAQYGTLVIRPDGSYTYTVNPKSPGVAALPPGASVVETVRYTVADGDGLIATAWLHITVQKAIPDTPIQEQDKPGDAIIIATPPPYTVVSHTGSGDLGLATDKPVVREVEAVKTTLESSVNSSLATLESVLAKMGAAERQPIISLTGGLEAQAMYAGQPRTLRLPTDLFRHSNGEEKLYYTATLADGRPLPSWLAWDGEALTLSGQPPTAEQGTIVIKIVARDRNNNMATAFIRLDVTESSPVLSKGGPQPTRAPEVSLAPRSPARDADAPAPVERTGTPALDLKTGDTETAEDSAPDARRAIGLSDQIAEHGQPALLQKALESLRALAG